MLATRLQLKNWRNFRDADVKLRDQTYLIGANASGKSNLLDVFRFLRDISKPQGGGLQKAIADRGGLSRLRCLHARHDPQVRVEIDLASDPDEKIPSWRYVLAFKSEVRGARRPLISCEQVYQGEKLLLNRPSPDDKRDPDRLTQTHLEQIQANTLFREIADFFASTTYMHLVPQMLKFGGRIGGQKLEDDPFGQGFLEKVAKTSPKTRDARIRKIRKALQKAVPHFSDLRFGKDKAGQPHLEALYSHHRPNAGWQSEEHFSDGTLRLVGLFWSLFEGDSLLLLEEPELSLNDAIVEQIPLMMKSLQRDTKRKRQIIISTHSEALLSNPGIDGRGILLLEIGKEGTVVRPVNISEAQALDSGLSPAEVILPKTRPPAAEQLGQLAFL